MRDSIKWITRILLVLLAVVIIDMNINWLRYSGRRNQLIITDLILIVMFAVLLIFQKRRRRF